MTQPPIILGLTGYAGTGKDTVRAVLEELGYHGMAFADPIRDMIRMLLSGASIDEQYMDSRALKESEMPELGVSYRQLAQTLGTEWGRSQQPDFWLRIAGAHMADLTANATRQPVCFVLSDVRFADEADWIRQRGGMIWSINRAGVAPVRQHVSEDNIAQLVAGADRAIDNNGTLDDLRTTVLNALVIDHAQCIEAV